MLKFDADKRPSALEASQHKYLESLSADNKQPAVKPADPSEFEFERRKLDTQARRALSRCELANREILTYLKHA